MLSAHRRDAGDQLVDRPQRMLLAAADDAGRSPVRRVQLAVIAQDARQRRMIVLVHDVGSRQGGPLIHPHVERSVETEREPPLPRIEMVRRHAQIGQNTVHPLDAVTTQPSSHEAEIGLDENESRIVGQVPPRIAVLIEGKQAPAVGKPLENAPRMASAAESHVDISPAGTDIEQFDALIEHYRYMIGFHKRTSGDTAQMYELLGQMHGKTRELLPLPYKPSSI